MLSRESKREIDRQYRAKRKAAIQAASDETKVMKKTLLCLEGRVFQLEKDLKETRAENIRLNKSLEKQRKELFELDEKHKKEMNDSREERKALRARNEEILVLHENLVCSGCDLEEELASGAAAEKCLVCEKNLL